MADELDGLPQAEIGIFGGSGFYELFEGDAEEVSLDTKWGRPSDVYTIGTIGGRRVAFLPRHGHKHTYAPSEVNYRANMWGMHELGVTQVIGPCSVGSLSLDIHPGDFVVPDQFVDRTKDRADTFFTHEAGLGVQHLSAAEPYCPAMRAAAVEGCRKLGITVHDGGTVVTIQGPRFSTAAESAWFTKMGWSCVNMTQYPEAWLARELGICYCGVCLVTDYDAGLGKYEAVKADDVTRVFGENLGRVRQLLEVMVPALPTERTCSCDEAAGLVH
ncbi:MAG: S-methyl-5'-thioadenosine phosphorylase [Atopobiaceae bacterium]|jgi:5'-methylthioadenosine phosphorylase|nr:S-methyl-5'-thioadenosine phosphorylase [Atopobiaceae bacterium]MCH4180676.1 S-methyl-5'-thioadenosine phosphorylase [Atopobiaceae bacterium]MCH4214693.1 S-methyl-5'-thioadenosine phosphorylase [Atopobiaceae bacterium]MCH4229901.1 S-methyl-5'-thioadenosine phosphorylase [Atopobiaceae bacterium]MCH4276739.1 S-methyl-5'-thioadenosine phosphorylase [Atopobiaceae bacterium]